MPRGSANEQTGAALLASRLSYLGSDPCGGSEVVFWEDRDILRRAGFPVRVYGRAAINGAPVEALPMHSELPLLSSLEYCWRFIHKEPHSVVIGYNEPTVAGLAPRRSIIRFDWATPLPKYWRLPVWLNRFQHGLYLFPSNYERELFLRLHTLIRPETCVVLPNAVDLQLFRPAEQLCRSAQVGFAGQWSEGKGITHLLEAWSTVRRQLPGAELHLAGGTRLWKSVYDTPATQAIHQRVEDMAQGGMVRVIGERKRSEMPEFWRSVSVAAVPSLREAFGLVAIEAMACGVPVVASAVDGLKEVIVDGECGLLVPPSDPGKLAQALVTLLTDEPLRRRLAEGARRRAEIFSLESRSKAFLALVAARTAKA